MRPTLHNRVPSSALLRFLKLQSESVCFFSPNPGPASIFDHAAPRGLQSRSHIGRSASKSTARRLSTTAARHATVEAGFVNFDFLWPRAGPSGLLPKPPSTIARVSEPARSNTLASQRHSSSWRPAKWHVKLWGITSKKGGRPLQPDDLPAPIGSLVEDGSDSIFSKGRSISAKAAAQPKLRCTELDENGNVVLASGEFKKSELIAKVSPPSTLARTGMLMLLL
jgi:magnesium transporter